MKPKFQASPVAWRPLPPTSLPPVSGEMTVPTQMTVKELARVLGQKPFLIIADLMKIGVFATASQELDFDVISKVIRKYGFVAKRMA